MNAPQRTICAEPTDDDSDYRYCGRPAVAPHPIDGYPRPLCNWHLNNLPKQENEQGL